MSGWPVDMMTVFKLAPKLVDFGIHIRAKGGNDQYGMLVIEYKGKWYSMSDNGGEIMVHEINTPAENSRPVFPLNFGMALDRETVLYRLMQVLDDQAIDYSYRAPKDAWEQIKEDQDQAGGWEAVLKEIFNPKRTVSPKLQAAEKLLSDLGVDNPYGLTTNIYRLVGQQGYVWDEKLSAWRISQRKRHELDATK